MNPETIFKRLKWVSAVYSRVTPIRFVRTGSIELSDKRCTASHIAPLPEWISVYREPWTKTPETPLAPLYQFAAEASSKKLNCQLYCRGTDFFFGDVAYDEAGNESRSGIFIVKNGDTAKVVVFPFSSCLGFMQPALLAALALHPNNPLRHYTINGQNQILDDVPSNHPE